MKSLLKILKFIKPYMGRFIGAFILLLISTGLNLIQPKLSQWAIDSGIAEGSRLIIIGAAAAMLVSGLIGAMFNFQSGKMLIYSALGMSYDLRNTLFKHISSFSFSNFDKWRTGELMVRMNSDVDTVRMFIRMGLFMLVQSFFMLIGSLFAMYITDVRLANLMAVIMAFTLVLFIVLTKFIRPIFLKVRKALDKVNNVLQENLAGAKLVRALSRQEDEKKKFHNKNRSLYDISLKVGVLIGFLFPMLMFIGNGALLATLWFGGLEVGQGPDVLTLGELVAFNNYAMMAIFPILMLAMVLNFIAMAIASADRIIELLEEKPALTEIPDAVVLDNIRGDVEFKNVCFKYGAGECAIENIDLSIKAGERIGIIGTTGSGKSTLVNLIPRYYDCSSGEITLDDVDVKNMSFESLRGNIISALQETVLFSGSIRDNIRFGRPDASDAEIERAAKDACAWEFITTKENGLDEEVGERGGALSGGQRQRIAIARSILAKPAVLILDDVTSALDLETETTILNNLYKRKERMTTIIISQKINAVKHADRVIIMDRGKITGIGQHGDLLKSNDMYREIENTQSVLV
ncbi:MAG TPA: multidrug ABC transporter ATP-binding protein [Spirochaeta sp.]|nr:multidrug ABC transporter ATP-binding protein [Spirochaeta sp.]